MHGFQCILIILYEYAPNLQHREFYQNNQNMDNNPPINVKLNTQFSTKDKIYYCYQMMMRTK